MKLSKDYGNTSEQTIWKFQSDAMASIRTQYRKMRIDILRSIINIAITMLILDGRQLERVQLQDFKKIKKDMEDMLFRATKPRQIYPWVIYLSEWYWCYGNNINKDVFFNKIKKMMKMRCHICHVQNASKVIKIAGDRLYYCDDCFYNRVARFLFPFKYFFKNVFQKEKVYQ